jgi:hypothetical protein
MNRHDVVEADERNVRLLSRWSVHRQGYVTRMVNFEEREAFEDSIRGGGLSIVSRTPAHAWNDASTIGEIRRGELVDVPVIAPRDASVGGRRVVVTGEVVPWARALELGLLDGVIDG